MADKVIQVCVTSPPYYGLRDYGISGQLGLESTPAEYIENMVAVGREIFRVLRDDGTWWLNLGDSYTGSGKARGGGGDGPASQKQKTNRGAYFETIKSKRIERGAGRWGGGDTSVEGLPGKNLMMIPARVALALQADGWYIRAEIVWAKPNPMPESIKDRPTRSHEMIYLLTKQARYYYDAEAVKEVAAAGWNGSSFTDDRDVLTKPNLGMGPRNNGGNYSKRYAEAQINHGGESKRTDTGYRNQRDVWTLATEPYSGAHYAVFPTEIPRRAILAGSKPGDVILDPFCGSGTSGEVCRELSRRFVGLDLSWAYLTENALPRAERKQTEASIATLPMFGGNGGNGKLNKQDGVGKPTYIGFNARWKESHK